MNDVIQAMTPAIVEDHHGEPVTTSLAIAEGVGREHKNVIELVRKYTDDLAEFGSVAFEMRPLDEAPGNSAFETRNCRDPRSMRGRPTEVAYLNEPQATLLLTYMRNSDVVRHFKKELVRAFYAMRQELEAGAGRQGPAQPTSVNHRADHTVAAQRAFGALFKAARTMGLERPTAVRRANAAALRATGVDLIEELDASEALESQASGRLADDRPSGVDAFLAAWLAGDLPVPPLICRSEDLAEAYAWWCQLNGLRSGLTPVQFQERVYQYLGQRSAGCWYTIGERKTRSRLFVPPSVGTPPLRGVAEWRGEQVGRFAEALAAWIGEASGG